MRRDYIDLTRGQMHYRWAGQGDPILLLHMSGSSSDEYEEVGNILAQHYQVFAPDFFGFGASDRPEHYLSFEEHMMTIQEFCKKLGLVSVRVVGNLVGANIACHLAAQYPELVKSLALFQVCYNPDSNYYMDRRTSFSQIPITEDGAHLKEIWARSAKYGEAADVTDGRAICLHKAGAFGEALHWALCEDTNFNSILEKVKTPAKIFAYRIMDVTTPEQAAAVMGNCRFEALDATPYFARATPHAFCEKILEFFE